jgi:hypothetical protein
MMPFLIQDALSEELAEMKNCYFNFVDIPASFCLLVQSWNDALSIFKSLLTGGLALVKGGKQRGTTNTMLPTEMSLLNCVCN